MKYVLSLIILIHYTSTFAQSNNPVPIHQNGDYQSPPKVRPQERIKFAPSTTDLRAHPDYKKPSFALGLSFASTALPAAMGVYLANRDEDSSEKTGIIVFSAAIILGPSTGMFYAEATPIALVGIAARSLLGIIGSSLILDSDSNNSNDTDINVGSSLQNGFGYVLLSLATIYAIGEVIIAPFAAHGHNQYLKQRLEKQISFAPMVYSSKEKGSVYGLALQGRF